jgi:uncharacterized membrane protein
MKKIYIIYGIFWLIAMLIVFQFSRISTAQSQTTDSLGQSHFTKGKIVEINNEDLYLQLLDEENKVIKTQLNDFYIHDDYKKGNTVSVYITDLEDGEKQYDIADYYHFDGLLFAFILFCILAILVARKKGLYSIISVVISLFFFYTIILNAVQAGISVILAGIIYVFLITILTIPLIHGFNKKSASAIIAVNIGYVIGFILTYFFTAVIKIGNTPSEEFRILMAQFPDVNIHQILIVSLFLGAVGALIDVAVTICSAIFEGMREQVKLTFAKTYQLGMNVGKDILGSMINTLLIAYLAAAFPFLVLMTLAKFNNVYEFLNYDFIALELTRIFIGAASIILLIPITSTIAAYLVLKRVNVNK